MPRLYFLFIAILFLHTSVAQSLSHTVSPVTVADFSTASPIVNNETEAVVLLDSGASTLDATWKEGFFIVYYRFRRILILKKKSLESLAKKSISFSAEMNGLKKMNLLNTLNAVTYNLVDSHIVADTLQAKDFYMEETKGDLQREKFAFPEAKEGSIIELEYSKRINSNDLVNWNFQCDYPTLKSVYTVQVPEFFNFAISFHNKKYLTDTKNTSVVKRIHTPNFDYKNASVNTVSWTYENVPPMREEAFVSTIDNYIASVKFQISAWPGEDGRPTGILTDWQKVCDNVLASYRFGQPIHDPSPFLRKQAEKMAGVDSTVLEKAGRIYSGVRDHFRVADRSVFISTNATLDDIYKSGSGDVGEINLILIAMLRSQFIDADPVILATRDNGLTNQRYPVLDNYNYVICRTTVDGVVYYLDASCPDMGFGKLPVYCYNGHARVITDHNFPVFLAPDSLKESIHTEAEIRNSNANLLVLKWTHFAGYAESSNIRSALRENTVESIVKNNTLKIPFKKSLDSFSLDNQKNLDESIVLKYTMTLDPGESQFLYFNPILNSGIAENPFKSAERSYPVEMPYVSDESYELNMEIPAGYQVEEMPKPETIFLNDSDARYDYAAEKSGNKIHIKSVMVMSRAIFEPEDYNRLKDFYANIIRKQSEMIVFKKI
jgi:hypothetical protein